MHLPGARGRRSFSPLAVFAFLSLFLSTASAAVLGIDLGTEYIKASLVKPGVGFDIVLTKDSKRKEAAAVSFKPLGKGIHASSDKDVFPERVYGSDAIALSARFPADTFVNLKSLLGVLINDPAVGNFLERYPSATIEPEQVRNTVALRPSSFESTELPFEVEELLAMQLKNVAANAEASLGARVTDVVITVPAYWTIEEKDAVRGAAALAELNVVALMTDGLAVGLNYAMTRTFPVVNDGTKGKPEHHIIYDMGAGGTTATVVRMQGRTVKDVGRFNKTIQEVQVMGVGWDKYLGGDALNTLILNDMIDKLAESPKIKALGVDRASIAREGRTISKLWKESERLRQVLSANIESSASFEGIYDESVSFKYKLKRSDYEKLAADFAGRVKNPIDMAMHSARLEFHDIESIIVHGGAQRTPFVQKALENAIGKAEKVRNNVNSDEAAAIGAAFLGASKSPSFRAKEIRSSEVAVHDVWMSWEQDSKPKKQKIFTEISKSGAPKILPFKQLEDFEFDIYQQVLAGDDMRNIPVWKIKTVNLTQAVKSLTEKHKCPADEVKTEFEIVLNTSDNIPEVMYGTVSCEVDEKKGGIVDGIKGLFGGKKDDQKVIDVEKETLEAESSTESSAKSSSKTEADASTETEKSSTPKKKTVKEYVGFMQDDTARKGQVSHMDFRRKQLRLEAFDKSDSARAARAEALNQLEAFTYRVRDLLDNEDFVAVSTEKQRKEITDKSSAASEWIYDDGSDAPTTEFQARLKELKSLVEPIQQRKTEKAGREEAIDGLGVIIESTRKMLDTMKEAAVKAQSEYDSSVSAASAGFSTATASAKDELDELDDEPASITKSSATPIPSPAVKVEDLDTAFEKLAKVEDWLADKIKAQKKLADSEDPVLLIQDLKDNRGKLSKITTDLLQKQLKAQAARMEAEKKAQREASKAKAKTKSSKTKGKSSSTSSTETASSSTTSKHDEL